MKPIPTYQYWTVLLLAALLINENIVQWALAVYVGGYSIGSGFADAFAFFSFPGYIFFTVIRLVPYVLLGILVAFLARTKLKDYSAPVFAGGFIGILSIILVVAWGAQRPYYSEEHVASTTALVFLIVPVYAIPAGIVGAILFAVLYTPFRSQLSEVR